MVADVTAHAATVLVPEPYPEALIRAGIGIVDELAQFSFQARWRP